MNCCNKSEAMTSDHETKNLIRSKYADIKIKVDGDVYHLDKLQLALKSDYFEKLFTEDFQERKSDLIELSIMDSNTFSTVVDIIYEKDLTSVMTEQNYISLLIAMDYLQMGIDVNSFKEFIKNNRTPVSFKLYYFVSENLNFKALLLPIFQSWSHSLRKVGCTEEFFNLPLEHFIEVISASDIVSSIQNMRLICQQCVNWIWHDVENRLPHAVELVNAVRRHVFPYDINDEKLLKKLQNISPDNIRREKFLTYFQQLLLYKKGEINTHNEFQKSELSIKEELIDFRYEKERYKLIRFFETGDFYDVTIKVEEKTYKLHRFKLTSMCGYFVELFSSEPSVEPSIHPERTIDTSIQLHKDIEYLLDGIAQTTFEMILKYIYLNEKIELASNNIARVLKAIITLKVETLMDKCYKWTMDNVENISSEVALDVMMILIRENIMLGNLHMALFCKHVPVLWPEIGDNVSLFRSITFDMLEEVLLSEAEYEYKSWNFSWNFCVDDQYKLLDICSKWIIHDVENRYHLIPRVAFAINSNCMVDYDDYAVETPADFNTCSQQEVRDKLWKILCSTSLNSSDVSLQGNRREFQEEPAYISLTKENEVMILNVELNPIASLFVYKGVTDWYTENRQCSTFISATLIRDNLFIFIMFSNYIGVRRNCFQVYNLSSKKFISLSCVPNLESNYDRNHGYALVNCDNEVYCCFKSGYLLKYSMQLNRWTTLSRCRSILDVRFASDGRSLYRMYSSVGNCTNFMVDIYNFEGKKWVLMPDFELLLFTPHNIVDLKFINGNLTALSELMLFIFKNQRWHHYQLNFITHPYQQLPALCNSLATVGLNVDVLVRDAVHYRLFNFYNWQLKKEISSKSYINIVAVQRLNDVDADVN